MKNSSGPPNVWETPQIQARHFGMGRSGAIRVQMTPIHVLFGIISPPLFLATNKHKHLKSIGCLYELDTRIAEAMNSHEGKCGS